MDRPYGLTVRGIIKNEDGEILMVKRHPKSRTDPEMWELPGVERLEKVSISPMHWLEKLKRRQGTRLESWRLSAEAVQNDYMHIRTVRL